MKIFRKEKNIKNCKKVFSKYKNGEFNRDKKELFKNMIIEKESFKQIIILNTLVNKRKSLDEAIMFTSLQLYPYIQRYKDFY